MRKLQRNTGSGACRSQCLQTAATRMRVTGKPTRGGSHHRRAPWIWRWGIPPPLSRIHRLLISCPSRSILSSPLLFTVAASKCTYGLIMRGNLAHWVFRKETIERGGSGGLTSNRRRRRSSSLSGRRTLRWTEERVSACVEPIDNKSMAHLGPAQSDNSKAHLSYYVHGICHGKISTRCGRSRSMEADIDQACTHARLILYYFLRFFI